ncbi:hypothetical protein D3OALGA1CA_5704 [Olavius algarvensis associated proteobacterium Delta 3]|nr:hypothetical protein D3OALGB2SA_2471 [Olavius algarvensis associated proteobacterium Delta 3]CAB5170578.1 hypothetical protein D3OALGA1CA_5704 [Olavius algarvensis associated proteobacterium Delta 3]
MSVHQTKDGRWYAIQRRRDDWRKFKKKYFGHEPTAEVEARAYDAEQINIRKQERDYDRKVYGFTKLVESYYADKYTTGKITETTYQGMWPRVVNVILPELGRLPYPKLTREKLNEYTAKRLKTQKTVMTGPKDNRKPKPLFTADGSPQLISPTTVETEQTFILTVLNWAVKKGLIPGHKLNGFEKTKRAVSVTKPPTPQEVQAIFSQAAPHLKRYIALVYYAGIRPGPVELSELEWDNMDFERGTILIQSARKGGPEARIVPLTEDALKLFKCWYNEDKETAVPIRNIIHYRGKPVKSIKRSWATAKRKAGITRKVKPYALRHAFATDALHEGGDGALKAVSMALGHSRPDTTLKIYQHATTALVRNLVKRKPALKNFSGETRGYVEKEKSKKKIIKTAA